MSKEIFITKTSQELNSWQNTKTLWEYLQSIPEGRYKITIQKSDKRTLQQNNWFHAVLPDIKEGLRDVGYNEILNEDDAKDFVKSMFFTKEISNGTDTVKVIQGTSETSKIDFASKADEIIIWAQQYLGINIAPPNKQFEFFE